MREVIGRNSEGFIYGRTITVPSKPRFMSNPYEPGTVKILCRVKGVLTWIVVECYK